MSWFTGIRDAIEGGVAAFGNAALPGLGLVTGQLVSKGAQAGLNSPLGKLAMLGGGVAGGMTGGMDNWGSLFDGASNFFNPGAMSAPGAEGYGAVPGAGAQQVGASAAGISPSGTGTDDAKNPFLKWLSSFGNPTGGNAWTADPATGLNILKGDGQQGEAGGMSSWLGKNPLNSLMSIGSGLYGMKQAGDMKDMMGRAIAGSSQWASGEGGAVGRDALMKAIQGDPNDPGLKFAERAAIRQGMIGGVDPGAAAAQASAQYRLQAIQALGGAAGVNFNPAQGYATALGGMGEANKLASASLGSIGFGIAPNQMPPWLQQYMIQNGMKA